MIEKWTYTIVTILPVIGVVAHYIWWGRNNEVEIAKRTSGYLRDTEIMGFRFMYFVAGCIAFLLGFGVAVWAKWMFFTEAAGKAIGEAMR